MTSTSRSDDFDPKDAPPGLITKDTPHIFSVLFIGNVVGVQWSGDRLIFYYEDGHKAYIEPTCGELHAGDWEVPTC